ncbi:TNF receptor-associated factor family protein [Carex littledalei]|uniref:TNF receptor-associated factor family protein n=1 Tax=Carex littledalei TaxID=544730 RepID=A0A833VGI5_9POAL|nr:TNF receptor-associated factor family protein [Carex littledalei]
MDDPVIEQKPEVAADPVIDQEPEVAADPVIEQEPEVAAAPVIKQEPEVAAALVIEQEPEVAAQVAENNEEYSLLQEPEVAADPVIEQEPEVAAALVIEQEPEVAAQVAENNEEYSLLPCKHCDIDIVQKLEEVLLHGLATACVEKTASDLFRGPTTVAPEVSKEMVESLIEKTELLLSEFSVEADENLEQIKKASTHPVEYISELVETFIGSKRNLLIRVSGWISSETREAKIDDTANQIAESNSFRSISEVLLRNMDIKGNFHCPEKFSTESEFDLHRENCEFRPVLPCDQECGEWVVRYEMEKHCSTICKMRLINCPFYNVGCESAFPCISLEKHCGEHVQQHLICVLRAVQRQGSFNEDLKQRVQLLEKSQSLDEMSGALDMRTMTLLLKEQEVKSKKLENLLKEQESKIKKLERELSKSAKG